jgi:hypothetical protein
MRIIWTNATDEQLEQDYDELLKQHKRALKKELNWDMFGGVITVNGRRY